MAAMHRIDLALVIGIGLWAFMLYAIIRVG